MSGKSWTIYRYDLNRMYAARVKHMWCEHVGKAQEECEKLNRFAIQHKFDMHYFYGDYNPDDKWKDMPTL